ncbi:response regulator [Caballeronia grimmiae]|uniref:response regulator n=1 Tax=Caballeronia grimmiae TaxID=1071679 RepID=UPI0038B9806D
MLEVSIFSVKGFRDAVGIIRERERGVTLPAARAAGPTVVIAEDNRLNRGLLRDQLLTLGATVLEAADGEEALDLLRKNRVDIVLTDMDMPKKSGAELLVAARALDPAMRVYAVSASVSTQDVEAGLARGFTDYLTKPLPLSVLADVLQTARVDHAEQTGAPSFDDADEDDDLPPRFPTVPAAYMRDLVAQLDEDIVALDRICPAKDGQRLRGWAHKLVGGLTVLGPSMLYDQCEELRTVLRESGQWVEDVDTFTASLRGDLIELRDMLHATLQAQYK